MRKITHLLLFLAFTATHTYGQSFTTTKDLDRKEGFFNFYYQEHEDRIFLEVKHLEKEFLYLYSLSTGVGSNDIGLDRGQLGREQVVYFKKAGNKLLLVQPNMRYRAQTDNQQERLSVKQAFAQSVLFGFPILETLDNTYLIDITDFLLQDAHDVAGTLQDTEQGNYQVDLSKSALEMNRTRTFPDNVEFEALLTFQGKAKGQYIRSVAPNPNLVTVIEHHSFIRLPDNPYTPRSFLPGCGAYPFSYQDYATPVHEPITRRLITRHRLRKKDPTAAVSEAVEPIVYYLDNGTPEPVRSALLEGARWWNQAFEAIGYKNAFQVKILPDDADPMDVRYNVIQWVHRSTRGWSYGGSVIDPRTGEIIKGHVSLGSLRIRQDFLIAQALTARPFATDNTTQQPMLDLALARIRQLSAHEIGHTLGFAHNFAASTNQRASVMDYPHPTLTLENGEIKLDNAYDTNIGEWDKLTVAYAYSELSRDLPEKESLAKILDKARQQALRYISDSDARPKGGAHLHAHLWDNDSSPVNELNNLLAIRQKAIAQFSSDNIRTYEPYSMLEDAFVPLYFLHRYQTEAVAKLIGGMDYNYAVKGDGQLIVEYGAADLQRNALEALLSTLSPQTLTIPADKLALFPPRAMGYPRTRESFDSKVGVAFDPVSAASSASDMTLNLLFHPERASRLVLQKSQNDRLPGLKEVIERVSDYVFSKEKTNGLAGEVKRSIQFNLIQHLIGLAQHDKCLPQVNAIAKYELGKLRDELQTRSEGKNMSEEDRIYLPYFIDMIDNMEEVESAVAPGMPDGSPIGTTCFDLYPGF